MMDLFRALIMVNSLVKALDQISPEILGQALLPLLQPVWPILCALVESKQIDCDILTLIGNTT
jgi:hypothetical protein